MAKMREFKFSNRKSDSSLFEETTEQLSLTRAVKNIQTKTKDRFVFCEWVSKKGKHMAEWIELPWGREKKLSR